MKQYIIGILVLCSLLVLGNIQSLSAAIGDIAHIKSHDKTLVVTDPSKGFNLYPRWAAFPAKATEYRKVVLYVTYQCPDGLHCGEWDYIDAINLRRIGGEKGQDLNIELARMISPYGWRFDSIWHFTWHVDITDFSFLLHDSVEIEFKHTGYESNTDRGWLITLDFATTEGRPAMTCLGMDTLWCGSFPYGDTSKPIESLLRPITFHNDSARFVRLRILQTGHGMDDSANCAEFCNKYRDVLFDDSLVNRRQIWRECGDNPLYPQSGTWIFDRANWCPGSIVHPDVYDFAVEPNSAHTINIDMEPYINPNKPSANWYIYAYLFYYSEPWAENDVSVEEIISPSTADEYSRLNPSCGLMFRVVIKNSGNKTVKSLLFRVGESILFPKDERLNIAPGASRELDLSLRMSGDLPAQGADTWVNDKRDEFEYDNSPDGTFPDLDELPATTMLLVRRNHDSTGNNWSLVRGVGGDTILTSDSSSHQAFALLKYKLNLPLGCYTFTLTDTAGDGLNFWYNVEGGYGYVRLLDTAGRLIKNFNSDFGNSIRYAFTVTDQPVTLPKQPPVVEVFPPRNQGKFEVDLFFDVPSQFAINIVSDSTKAVVFTKQYSGLKDTLLPLDISSQPDGVYWLKLTIDKDTLTRRIRVKRGN